MTYIRTKDAIMKHPHPNAEVFTSKYDICKEANTIEELCDEFVVKYEDTHNLVDYDCAKTIDIEVADVYGAIWTEWGLKYVAKMNDKGELELIKDKGVLE